MVADLSLGGRCEDRFRQPVRLKESGRKGDAADGARFPVLLPAGTSQVTSDDTFHGQRTGFFYQHGTSTEGVGVFPAFFGKIVYIGGDQMVGNDVFHLTEPECGNTGEHISLAGYSFVHDDVEGGYAVGGDDEEFIAQVIDVADLAAPGALQVGEVG